MAALLFYAYVFKGAIADPLLSLENAEENSVQSAGRDEPVLGFAPATARKPIPVLDYQLEATGPATLAWVLTPYSAERPSVQAKMSRSAGGTVVTVSHAEGTDMVYVAPRGERQTVTLGPRKLGGRIAVVRLNRQDEIVTAAAE